MLEKQMRPVDPELFVKAFDLMDEWANTPIKKPKKKAIHGFYLTDVPANRIGLRLMGFCHDHNLSEDARMSFGMRVMSFGEVFEDSRIKSFMHDDEVHESLIRAVAIAPYSPNDGFDKDKLFAIAEANRRDGAS